MAEGVSNHIRSLFEKHALRCTRQREVLYEALAATKTHPTADELFQSVKSRDEGLSLATVYNTLEAFSAVGLVRRIPSANGSGACRFDADTADHVHIATSDGRILDVPHELSQQVLAGIPASVVADLERQMGIRVSGLSVQIVAEAVEPRS